MKLLASLPLLFVASFVLMSIGPSYEREKENAGPGAARSEADDSEFFITPPDEADESTALHQGNDNAADKRSEGSGWH